MDLTTVLFLVDELRTDCELFPEEIVSVFLEGVVTLTVPLSLVAVFTLLPADVPEFLDELVKEFLEEDDLATLADSLFCSNAYLFVALLFLLVNERSGYCLSYEFVLLVLCNATALELLRTFT